MKKIKEKTLLEIARSANLRSSVFRKFSPEEIKLALAWANDEITLAQVEIALYGKTGGAVAYSFLARALRTYIKQLTNH